jgi:hypothetical protein
MKKTIIMLLLICLCVPFAVDAKKSKEEKRKMSVLEKLESIQWDSPDRVDDSDYEKLNTMYNTADTFYAMIQAMPDSVALYEIRKVYREDKGDTILAPVNIRTNELSTSMRAVDQSLAGLNYVLDVTIYTMKLTAQMTGNATMIAIDATPLGNSARKKANKQIAGFVKIYPTIVSAIKEQARLMQLYKQQNESLSQDDGPVTSLPGEDLTSDVVMTMSDEEIASWLEAEQPSRS